MGRIYRLALRGRLETEEATRLTYVLKEIRACLEAEQMAALEARLAELATFAALNRDHGPRIINGSHAIEHIPSYGQD